MVMGAPVTRRSGCASLFAEVVIPPSTWYKGVKRLIDVSLAGVILVISSPIILLAMILVRMTSPGPAIYSQVRLGLKGRPFTIYKIRSMRVDSEVLSGARWASVDDPRVTTIGALLRITHIDELPQLWNVLRGEMSLVGPRPERPEIASQLQKAIPLLDERLLIRPGLTGLAQLQLPPDTSLESVRRKLACDLYYVEHHGFSLDMRIIMSTLMGVLGIPFSIARWLLQIPSGWIVESNFLKLLAQKSIGHTRRETPSRSIGSDHDTLNSAVDIAYCPSPQ
jgi:lipopolysaccharide/colanic/teichoic acid biosynthesis glycosyltransferase